jgi:hypothetical protein
MAAHADPINPVTGSAGGFSGSGTLVTTSNGDGSYTIIDISGTGVTGLIAPGGFNFNDNQLFPSSSSVVDGNGFAFTDTQGNTSFQIDLYSSAGSYFIYLLDNDGYSTTVPVDVSVSSSSSNSPESQGAPYFHHLNFAPTTQDFNFSFDTPSPTPEPSSVLLLGTGLMAAAGFAYRRKR